MNKELLKQALTLATELDLAVFPCNVHKRPLTPNGFKDASTNTEVISRAFSNPGAALVGVAVPDGVIVLDRDAAQHAAGELDLPDTWTTYTRFPDASNAHYWYRMPEGVTVSDSTFKASGAAGWDLRLGGKHYVIAAGERPGIGEYRLDRLEAPDLAMAELPAHALAMMLAPAPAVPAPREGEPESPQARYRLEASFVPLLSADGWDLAKGDGDSPGSVWNYPGNTSGQSATVTPTGHRLRVYGANATFAGQALPNEQSYSTYDLLERLHGPQAAYDMAATAYPTEAPQSAVESSWGLLDLTERLAGTFKPFETTMLAREDGVCLLYPGRTHAFIGESESGKSWLALLAARERMLLGEDVCLVDFEDSPDGALMRLRILGVPDDVIRAHFRYVQPHEPILSAARLAAHWDALTAATVGCTLVILDGLNAALALNGADSNSTDEVTVFMTQLPDEIIRRTGAAVVIVDHVTKSREGRGRMAIGSQAKMSTITGVVYIVEPLRELAPGKVGQMRVSVAKDRNGWVRAKTQGDFDANRAKVIADVDFDSTTTPSVVTVNTPGPRGGAKARRMNAADVVLEALSEGACNQSQLIARVQAKHETTFGQQAIIQAAKLEVERGTVVLSPGPNRSSILSLIPGVSV